MFKRIEITKNYQTVTPHRIHYHINFNVRLICIGIETSKQYHNNFDTILRGHPVEYTVNINYRIQFKKTLKSHQE